MGETRMLKSVYMGDTVPVETIMEAGRKGYQQKEATIEKVYMAISGGEVMPLKVCIEVKPEDYGTACVDYRDMNKLERLMRDLKVRTSDEMAGRKALLYTVNEFPGRILGLSAPEE